LLRTKLKVTELSPIKTPPLNTARRLLNPIANGYSSHWLTKNLSAFGVVFVSGDHMVYNKP